MKTEDKKNNNNKTLALSFAWELGYSIVIPLVALALGGRLLDNKFGTSPFLFLTAVILSVFLSTFIVYKKASQVIGGFEKMENKEKETAKNEVITNSGEETNNLEENKVNKVGEANEANETKS